MATPTIEIRPFTNEHVTIRSPKSFSETKARLESVVPRIDDGIFTLLRYGEADRALRELEASANLSIFSFRDHGALLAIAGQKRRSIQYDIGNPLTASKMTRYQLSAGITHPRPVAGGWRRLVVRVRPSRFRFRSVWRPACRRHCGTSRSGSAGRPGEGSGLRFWNTQQQAEGRAS
jgi:hypothetical protein